MMIKKAAFALFLVVSGLALNASKAEASCPFGLGYVETTQGCIRGNVDLRIMRFLGIPYAAPPVGALRWKAPAPVQPWVGIRPTIAIPRACPQTTDTSPTPQSEDCLYLNVWAPTAGRNLPVMFWIHGGGLHQGQSGLPLYDGKNMAETFHTVVVSINYRLGQLGFLAHPELSAENTKRISGNYGFLDQLAALMWVKENIHAFGGDPAQVTIFGESAGAWSVAAHLASPLSAGLFRAAIAESGPSQRRDRALRSPTTMMPESAEAQGVRFAHALGCPSTGAISCMRAKPASQIVSTLPATAGANGGEVYLFAIDGYAFTDIPTRMILSRHFNGVPFITGINGNESTLFTKDIEVPDAAAYTALIRKTFASSAERVLQLYPAVRYPTPKAALDAVWSDYDYVCPTRRLARAYSDVEPRTWLYQFTWVTPFGTSSGLGSYHTSELEFVFGNFNRPLTPPSPTELALSANIMTRWNSLARGLAPGSDWPAYTSTADRHLVLEAPIRVARGLNTAGCDFFDSIDLVP